MFVYFTVSYLISYVRYMCWRKPSLSSNELLRSTLTTCVQLSVQMGVTVHHVTHVVSTCVLWPFPSPHACNVRTSFSCQYIFASIGVLFLFQAFERSRQSSTTKSCACSGRTCPTWTGKSDSSSLTFRRISLVLSLRNAAAFCNLLPAPPSLLHRNPFVSFFSVSSHVLGIVTLSRACDMAMVQDSCVCMWLIFFSQLEVNQSWDSLDCLFWERRLTKENSAISIWFEITTRLKSLFSSVQNWSMNVRFREIFASSFLVGFERGKAWLCSFLANDVRKTTGLPTSLRASSVLVRVRTEPVPRPGVQDWRDDTWSPTGASSCTLRCSKGLVWNVVLK